MKKNGLLARMKKNAGEKAASLAVFVGLGAGIGALMPASCDMHMLESAKLGRHSVRTIDHVVRGTEGERAIESYMKAEIDPAVRAQINEEGIALMKETYDANETFIRQAKRFYTLSESAATEAAIAVRDTSEQVSGGLSEKIKGFWYKQVTGDAELPNKQLDERHELNVATREFNDANEKAEKTTQELLNYIEQHGVEKLDTVGIRHDIDEMADNLIDRYGVENNNFKLHDHYSTVLTLWNAIQGKMDTFKPGDLEKHVAEVDTYQEKVDTTRANVEAHSPIETYEDPSAWLEYVAHPVPIGAAAGLLGFLATYIPGVPGRTIRKGTALPGVLAYKGALATGKGIGKGVSYLGGLLPQKELKTTEDSDEDGQKPSA